MPASGWLHRRGLHWLAHTHTPSPPPLCVVVAVAAAAGSGWCTRRRPGSATPRSSRSAPWAAWKSLLRRRLQPARPAAPPPPPSPAAPEQPDGRRLCADGRRLCRLPGTSHLCRADASAAAHGMVPQCQSPVLVPPVGSKYATGRVLSRQRAPPWRALAGGSSGSGVLHRKQAGRQAERQGPGAAALGFLGWRPCPARPAHLKYTSGGVLRPSHNTHTLMCAGLLPGLLPGDLYVPGGRRRGKEDKRGQGPRDKGRANRLLVLLVGRAPLPRRGALHCMVFVILPGRACMGVGGGVQGRGKAVTRG